MQKKKAFVYVWTGIGAGKTTSALGVALRQVGHRHKVIIIQFMKGRKDIGEYKVKDMLAPYYEIYQFGKKGWVDLKSPSRRDKALAQQGLRFAWECLKKKPHLLILDEINLAAACQLVDTKDIIKLVDAADPKTTIYLTGRYAPKELIDRADFVTEFVTVKQPKRMLTRRGIEY